MLASALLVAAGCGGKHDAGDGHGGEKEAGGHGHEHEEGSGTQFQAGKGVRVSEQARKTMGIETAEVTEEKITSKLFTTVAVFRPAASGLAMAAGFVTSDAAKQLKVDQEVELRPVNQLEQKMAGRLRRIDAEVQGVLHQQTEILIELPDPEHRFTVGTAFDAVLSGGAERTAAVVPRSALLRSAAGNFVFVKNGEHFIRTPVKVGTVSDGFVEIIDGLYAGDIVVTKGVEDLWLVELRFTKGGGHSH